MLPARVWAISDIHIDYEENRALVESFARGASGQDTLIIAGDVTDRLERLEALFAELSRWLGQIVFIPGNHEFWQRAADDGDAMDKLAALEAVCRRHGVVTEPIQVGAYRRVWVVPLWSWYDDRDAPVHSLYLSKPYAEDETDRLWVDFHRIRWPASMPAPPASWFADRNAARLSRRYDAPVITLSHFLPRQELMFSLSVAEAMARAPQLDPMPAFNFSRVAGSRRIEAQLRQLGSVLHVYGHQHRNRTVTLENVTYVSHCLGYPRERQSGAIGNTIEGPLCIWREDLGFMVTNDNVG